MMEQSLLERFAALEQERMDLEGRLRQVKDKLAELEPGVIDQMQNLGVDSCRVGNRTLRLETSVYCSVADKDYERACELLEELGLDDFVARQPVQQRVRAYFNELYREHGEIPKEFQDAFNVAIVTKVRSRKS